MLKTSAYFVSRHVMNELIETERVYVEELLSVLEVIWCVICFPNLSILCVGLFVICGSELQPLLHMWIQRDVLIKV